MIPFVGIFGAHLTAFSGSTAPYENVDVEVENWTISPLEKGTDSKTNSFFRM